MHMLFRKRKCTAMYTRTHTCEHAHVYTHTYAHMHTRTRTCGSWLIFVFVFACFLVCVSFSPMFRSHCASVRGPWPSAMLFLVPSTRASHMTQVKLRHLTTLPSMHAPPSIFLFSSFVLFFSQCFSHRFDFFGSGVRFGWLTFFCCEYFAYLHVCVCSV